MAARNVKSPMVLAAMLAAAAGLPRLAPSGSSFAFPAASAPASEQRLTPPPPARELDGWSGPLRLYGEFFGREPSGDLTAADTQDAVARYLPADRGGYELDFVVALVPDPIDSEMPAAFDQALDGIQRGFANRFFLLDRRWLPWRSSTATAPPPPAQSGLHRVSPGLLLFRRDGLVRDDALEHEPRCLTAAADLHGEPEHCLVGVFLVGETPKRGIHQAAFLQALRLIRALSGGGAQPGAAATGAEPAPAGRVPTVKVIGPSYSGSADSLRRAVRLARLALGGPLDFEIVTGSATAIDTDPAAAPAGRESFEQQLECESQGSVSFWRAVIPDRLLQPAALQKLHEKMGWDLTRVALVVEGDTEYGQRLGRVRFERRHPGHLTGVVRDAHGGPLPGVKVTVIDQGTGWSQSYQTGKHGSYAATELPPERYTVAVDLHGSRQAIHPDVVVEADATVTVDLRLGAAVAQAPRPRATHSGGGGEDACVTLSVSPVSVANPQASPSSLDVTSKALDRALILHFPTHVAAIRGASAGAATKQQAAPQPAFSLAPRQTELDLDLADEGAAADSIPELSKLTAPENEQAIANLLGEISREGIGYVGILATDVRDKLYLAARIRGFAPDVTLFTFDGDLLYTHRQVEKYMNGVAVLSTFQLFTEGGAALHGVDLDLFHRRQFTSELAEGVFHAVRALLSPSDKKNAQGGPKPLLGWISVTSNGSLWPLLSIELKRGDVQLQGYHVLAVEDPDTDAGAQQDGPPPQGAAGRAAVTRAGDAAAGATAHEQSMAQDEPLSQRADLELLIAGVVLCWLARSLRRAAPPTPRAPGLLASGLLLLALAGGLLLALEGIEYLRPFGWLPVGWVDPYPLAHMHAAQWLYFLGLGAVYLVLAYHFAASWRRADPPPESRPAAWWLGWLGWLGVAAAALAAIWFALLVWFIPGEVEYFELRARVFSSGLSPVVSLAWLVGALYLWVLLELKRRCVTAWHEVEWPLLDGWDPALARCGKLAGEVRQLISRLPWGRWVAAAAAAAALLSAWLILRRQVQPAAESPAYAGAFLALLLIAVACSGISFWRFLQVWRKLRSILLRVEETPLKTHFKGLAEEVAWKPMRSFGWQLPRFNTLEISTRKLQALLRRDRADRPDHLVLPPALDDAFLDRLQRRVSGAFAADVEGSPEHQIERRHRLQRLLTRASRQLGSVRGDPDIEDFLALRVVAYLRYVFAQLRGYLMGGLFPGLLLLIAISCYAFEPKSFCSLGLLAGLLAALAATVGVFASMNRDAVLSRISGSETGEVSLDRAFFGNLLTYIVLPLLGLLATQVPAAGSLLDNWLRPLLRIFGLG
jgi:hypothetical protein